MALFGVSSYTPLLCIIYIYIFIIIIIIIILYCTLAEVAETC
jgi:hypothetical protein